MPYKSAAQRAYMHIHHPEIAARWDKKYGGGGHLPQHVKSETASETGDNNNMPDDTMQMSEADTEYYFNLDGTDWGYVTAASIEDAKEKVKKLHGKYPMHVERKHQRVESVMARYADQISRDLAENSTMYRDAYDVDVTKLQHRASNLIMRGGLDADTRTLIADLVAKLKELDGENH